MQRVKNVGYDDEDLYDDDDALEYADEQTEAYTAENKANFANLTPVVRAELEEDGVQVSDTQIEEALWHYYWDVAKSVAYLKNSRTPRKPDTPVKKEKAVSKFDQAAQKNAERADRDRTSLSASWFAGISWTDIPADVKGDLVPVTPLYQPPKLLGGSSKLAKLAEERRKKAAAASQVTANNDNALSALDRLTKTKDERENVPPAAVLEPKKYPIRRKKEPSPPPKSPSPPPAEPEEPVTDLRTLPSDFGRTFSVAPQNTSGLRRMSLDTLLGRSPDGTAFKAPSPDDQVLEAQGTSRGTTKQTISANRLTKKTEALKLNETTPAPSQPKVRSKNIDVPAVCASESATRKISAAFVVIGHVDHGKSTLMGRLLLDSGAVSQRDVDKYGFPPLIYHGQRLTSSRYKKQATELGKASFALAWVMDTGTEERERGVTVDIAQHYFSTDEVDFTILDAPGHRDFVPNMIAGASMADFAVLVVDANQLESGVRGQTQEHIVLARAVGLTRIVVAVNKLDSTNPPWDRAVFDDVSRSLLALLQEAGYAESDIAIVPCSGLTGENVVRAPTSTSEAGWTAGLSTLLQHLEKSVPTGTRSEVIKAPLRLHVADVFRGGLQNPLSVSGRLSRGNVQVGDSVSIQPSGETATVKGIEVGGDSRDWAVAGEIATLHLVDTDPQNLRAGDVVCDLRKPVIAVCEYTATVAALETLLPQKVDVHAGRLHVSGLISQLVSIIDAGGDSKRKKPRVVKAGQTAIIKMTLEDASIPLEQGDRLILRGEGNTIASGVIS